METGDDASISKYRAHPAASDEVGIWIFNHFFGERDPRSLNLAVLTGVNRLVVLDFDSEEIPKCLKDCRTAIVRTARGYHYYFSTRVHLQSEPNCTIDGVHCGLRADGEYVVIPGSVHPSGCQYRFINPLSAIQPLPQAVVRRLSARNQAKCSGQQRGLLGGLDLPCVQALLRHSLWQWHIEAAISSALGAALQRCNVQDPEASGEEKLMDALVKQTAEELTHAKEVMLFTARASDSEMIRMVGNKEKELEDLKQRQNDYAQQHATINALRGQLANWKGFYCELCQQDKIVLSHACIQRIDVDFVAGEAQIRWTFDVSHPSKINLELARREVRGRHFAEKRN